MSSNDDEAWEWWQWWDDEMASDEWEWELRAWASRTIAL